MNRSALTEVLKGVGKPPESWESPDGTSILVLPYGGRVLGLFAAGDDNNFLWTNPAFITVDSARAFLQTAEWHNSGGDRTWLAPEVDFFFPDFPDLKRYRQQRALDPGHYEVSRENSKLSWRNRATLTMSRTQREVEVEITKSLEPALNPLRHDDQVTSSGLRYAGYTLHTSLQVVNTDQVPQIGLWQLVQVPHGGEMLVPTIFRCEPKVLFGTIAPGDLIVGTHLMRYKMQAAGGHKIGVKAAALTGRVAYLYTSAGEFSLVVRNFGLNPSGEYIDVPWTEPENLGFAFQACNVDIDSVAFSELEYHVPSLSSSGGKLRSDDESQLWAFRGPWMAIQSVVRRLLSEEIELEMPLPN